MQDFAQGGLLDPEVFELRRRLGFRAVVEGSEGSTYLVQRTQMLENLIAPSR